MEPVRIALIGVGGMGASHLQQIAEQEREGRMRLVAVADPFADRLAEVKAGLEKRGVRWRLDYQELLEQEPELDAVVISTPVPYHFEMAAACIRRGLKISLEKPPVPLIQQLNELIALDSEQKVTVGFQQITSMQVQQMKQWIVEGRLGAIREIRVSACWPRHTGYYQRAAWAGRMTLDGQPVFDGPATNALSHLVHNVMFFAGRTLEEFAAPVRVQAEIYRARPIESYDVFSLRGWFPSGATCVLALTHATRAHQSFRMEVRGSKDWARIGRDGATLESSAGEHSFGPGEPIYALAAYYSQLADFCSGVRSRPISSLQDTRGYVLATNGALLSSKGVHDLPASAVRTYGEGDQQGYEVVGLTDLVNQSFEQGLLFSELGASWARSSQPVSVENLRALELS